MSEAREPHVHSFQLGGLRCSVIFDSVLRVRPELVLPPDRRSGWPRLELDSTGRLRTPVFALLIEGNQRVLIDAGSGERPDLPPEGQGQLGENLAALGVQCSAIDVVVFTHAHRDHVGGSVASGAHGLGITYPKARHVLTRADWTGLTEKVHAGTAGPSDVAAHRALSQVQRAGALDLVDAAAEVSDSVRLLDAAGHTPGNSAIEVTSDGASLIFVGDTFHHPAQVEDTLLISPLDHDPVRVPAARLAIIRQALKTGAIVAAAHFRFPSLGHLEGSPEAARFVPLSAVP